MSVVVSQEDVGPCRKQLTVEVPAPAVEAETQRVLREIGNRVKVPGFRKGKVPADLVRRRFAKDIEQEVKDRLLPRYWRQAQAEASLEPLLPPEVGEVTDLKPGEPLTFVATVETRPVIELVPMFSRGGHHHVPVLDDDGHLAGIITQTDLVRALYRAVKA